jgi:hypothetical protein
LKTRAPVIERKLKLSGPGPYSHLTNEESIESLKRLIKKANSTKGLSSRTAREILLEDRR